MAEWLARVERQANAQGGANSVTLMIGDYVRLLRCAEVLGQLVKLDGQIGGKYEGDWHTDWEQAWQTAEAALRGDGDG